MCLVAASPRCCQVRPPSTVRYTPSPGTTLFRANDSPVPTHTTFGSDSETAIAPIDAVSRNPSDIGRQYWPASSVIQTPPEHAPIQNLELS